MYVVRITAFFLIVTVVLFAVAAFVAHVTHALGRSTPYVAPPPAAPSRVLPDGARQAHDNDVISLDTELAEQNRRYLG